MNLQTLKNRNSEKGFTIVELLIVIVVIAILAAISIVAYTGIQNRAKASSGQQLASQIAKKMEAYYAVNSAYPTTVAQVNGTPESRIEGLQTASSPLLGVTATTHTSIVTTTALTADTAKGGAVVRINGTSTGGNVYYWDYTKSTGQETAIKYGQ